MDDRSTVAHAPREHVDRLRMRVEEALQKVELPDAPAHLYDPVRYVLDGQGKRLRPVLVLLGAETFGVQRDEALPAALAVELFHNFTLVHDDIMDHADSRRGRPTVHLRWDENVAILCGDYLMAMAYDQLAASPVERLPVLLRCFHGMVARLCEGQTLDKEFETRGAVTTDEYLDMIDRKTGALIQTCLALGALLGTTAEPQLEAVRDVGRSVGRAFQIQDDLLDLTTESPRWGKAIGGDLVEGKRAYLLLRALETSSGADRQWFERIVANGGLPEEEVPEARRRMEALGVLEDARAAVRTYTERALDGLERLPAGTGRDTLGWLFDDMCSRHH